MTGEVGRHGKYDTVCLVGVSSHDTKQQVVVQTTEKRLRPIILVICITCTSHNVDLTVSKIVSKVTGMPIIMYTYTCTYVSPACALHT